MSILKQDERSVKHLEGHYDNINIHMVAFGLHSHRLLYMHPDVEVDRGLCHDVVKVNQGMTKPTPNSPKDLPSP